MFCFPEGAGTFCKQNDRATHDFAKTKKHVLEDFMQ